MEFFALGKGKLKISLGREELLRRNLEGEKLDYHKEEAREAIRALLEDASRETGFSAPKNPVFQVFTSKDGGCEIFIYGGKDTYRYRFSDMATLLQVCAALAPVCQEEEGAAYALGDGTLLLQLAKPSPVAEEFCISSDVSLQEGASLLCPENAVQILGALA